MDDSIIPGNAKDVLIAGLGRTKVLDALSNFATKVTCAALKFSILGGSICPWAYLGFELVVHTTFENI